MNLRQMIDEQVERRLKQEEQERQDQIDTLKKEESQSNKSLRNGTNFIQVED